MDEKNVLTPQKAFVSLALFNQLRFALNILPKLISFYAMVGICFHITWISNNLEHLRETIF